MINLKNKKLMKIIGIIPARLASTRLPNKPLADIHGMPMIGHVYMRSLMCKDLSCVYVATCDKQIYDYIKSINGNVVMTKAEHESSTDRTAEALLKIEKELNTVFDIVVMIQGDEPMITNDMIGNALSPIIMDEEINVVNLMSEIQSIQEFNDPNVVKVVVDIFNFALYFSREPIPSAKMGAYGFPMLKRVNVIPFRRDFLISFNNIPQTPLEIIESIGMMRLIENGLKVKMVMTDIITHSVDSEADLELIRNIMKDDSLMTKYNSILN